MISMLSGVNSRCTHRPEAAGQVLCIQTEICLLIYLKGRMAQQEICWSMPLMAATAQASLC